MDYKVERGLWAAGVMALTVAVFAVNVRNRLLRFDDLQYIAKNRAIAGGLTPRSVWWSLTSAGYAGNWHPLTWMSHALDNTLADGCALDWRAETVYTPEASSINFRRSVKYGFGCLAAALKFRWQKLFA